MICFSGTTVNVRFSVFVNLAVSIIVVISAREFIGVSLIEITLLLCRVDRQRGICATGVEGEYNCSFIRELSECSIKFKLRVG